MSEENKAIVRRFVDELFGKRNMAIVDELFAPEFVNHYAPPGLSRDVEGFKQSISMFLTAFPDIQITIEDMVAEGDKVVARVTGRGTHTGNFQAIPPTGKQATVPVIVIWRISGGKFVERWEIVDRLGMLQQLGVIPTPGQSG